MTKRTALTRDRIVLAAVSVADPRRAQWGEHLARVGRELGVEAMSLTTTSPARTT